MIGLEGRRRVGFGEEGEGSEEGGEVDWEGGDEVFGCLSKEKGGEGEGVRGEKERESEDRETRETRRTRAG